MMKLKTLDCYWSRANSTSVTCTEWCKEFCRFPIFICILVHYTDRMIRFGGRGGMKQGRGGTKQAHERVANTAKALPYIFGSSALTAAA